MKLTIDIKKLYRHGLNLKDALIYLCNKENVNSKDIKLEHLDKGYCFFNSTENRFIYTDDFINSMSKCIKEEGEIITNPDYYLNHLTDIAKELKEIFPKGKKEGVNQYWSEGITLIEKRLILFSNKYPGEYTKEDIIDAAKRYVSSFNGNYNYMRTLKYFIFKNDVKTGEVEYVSELLNYIENKEDINIHSDWTAELV